MKINILSAVQRPRAQPMAGPGQAGAAGGPGQAGAGRAGGRGQASPGRGHTAHGRGTDTSNSRRAS